jgi:hypothetical protein
VKYRTYVFVLAAGLALLLALTVTAQRAEGKHIDLTTSRGLFSGPSTDPYISRTSTGLDYTSPISFTPAFTAYIPIAAQNYDSRLPYLDDFSDSDSGWFIGDSGDIKWSYQSDEYEMLIRNEYWWAGATAPLDGLGDCFVEADMRRYSGSKNYYGLIFGLEDWEHFYLFIVRPNTRYYSVFRIEPDNWTRIVDWRYSYYINTGSTSNRLKVERSGSQISVYVNDHLLTTTNDSTYPGCLCVGVYAETLDSTPMSARYDDFTVWHVGTGSTAFLKEPVSDGGWTASGGPSPVLGLTGR